MSQDIGVFVEKLSSDLSDSGFPLYDIHSIDCGISSVVRYLEGEGYNAIKLKRSDWVKKHADSYIILISKNGTDLAVKIYPEIGDFGNAKTMYENKEELNGLSSKGFIPEIYWTANTNNPRSSLDIRTVIYSYKPGETLDKLDQERAYLLKKEFVRSLEDQGYTCTAKYDDLVLTTDEIFGEHVVLTDLNKIYRTTSN